MTLPLVRLAGTPYEQGFVHGETLYEQIENNLGVYFARFERELKLTRVETLRRADQYAEEIAEQCPAYHEGMRGIADGSGVSLAAIAALNVRYELFYDEFAEKPMPDGCTAFALLPEATSTGHLLIGENWDWIAGVRGAIIHTEETDGLRTLAFTEAGIFGGKIGMNSAGLGLLINGLTSRDDDWSRLRRPFHARCYEILRSRTLEEAVRVVLEEDRSCSANFVLAQTPDQVLDLETSPDRAGQLQCQAGCLVHSNHFVNPTALGIVERNVETNPHSQRRHARLERLLQAQRPVSLADVQAALRDHEGYPYSVCFHIDPNEPPEEFYESVTSLVMDLQAGTLYATDGPPCGTDYVLYHL
ncbi:peptidase C45 [Candidatus Chloroploca sp. M-50]|uniref:Peptidase C45 n=1 Tax=Candidatus Chloroploca mongolica TaxID=2528176 RepID=A0ABS4DBE5_9CHLR|nr:C45 family peptidase [Candidatus Chloroploca mongolica]MBP1466766.1 peptidase C45 [Candidatus Chloroploca mongolica]